MDLNKLGWVVGGVGAAVATYVFFQNKKLSDKVGMTMEDLAKKTPIDIEAQVIDAAVAKAVDREVGRAVKEASDEAVRSVSENMKAQVATAVKTAYSSVQDSVSEELTKQVSNINTIKLEQAVIEKAKVAVVDKLNEGLDDIRKSYERDLEAGYRLYGPIARSLLERTPIRTSEPAGITFKIGT